MCSVRAAFVLALACLTIAPGCRKYDVEVANEVDPTAPASVRLLGEEQVAGTGELLKLRLPAEYRHSGADGVNTTVCLFDCGEKGPVPALTLRVETRCGPVELCIEMPEKPSGGYREPVRAMALWRKREGSHVCTPEFYRLWIDNRGLPVRTITIGALRRAVPADQAMQLEVAAPACEGMGAVALDGAGIGSLPVIAGGQTHDKYAQARRDFVVDPGGARCYRSVTHYYAADSSGPAWAPVVTTYRRAQLHPLERPVDGFLTPVPETVETPTGSDERTQILEVPCQA